MKSKILIGSIGAVVILLLAGVTPVVLAQQTTEIMEKEVIIEEKQGCPICPFSAAGDDDDDDDRLICKICAVIAAGFLTLAAISATFSLALFLAFGAASVSVLAFAAARGC